jgi:ribonuclease HII
MKARFQDDNKTEIGVDEAGRGPFFGPIMAAAVCLPREWTDEQRTVFLQLRDSKKVSPKKRDALADALMACLPTCAVGVVHVTEINERGIQWANREAFRRAIRGVLTLCGGVDGSDTRLVIDGTLAAFVAAVATDAEDEKGWAGEQQLVVDGDATYIAVAGASILAKVAHDRWIQEIVAEKPEWQERYDLLGSKGYGTARHREGLRLYGACEQHREAFIQKTLAGAAPNGTGSAVAGAKAKVKAKGGCLINFSL